jgi:hypothetical protein
MGVIIYGQRLYGKVDEQGGEYCATKFFHIDFVPLIPVSSHWVLPGNRVVDIKWNWRSIVAAYARTWGTVAALALGVGGGISEGKFSMLAVGGLFAVVVAMSWSWRHRRSDRAQLRGNLNAMAFGYFCNPEFYKPDLHRQFAQKLDREAQSAGFSRPPEDVARFGSQRIDEIACAYGRLSLHGVKSRADVAKLLDLHIATPESTDGVYRQAGSSPSPTEFSSKLRDAIAGSAARVSQLRATQANVSQAQQSLNFFQKCLWGSKRYQALPMFILASLLMAGVSVIRVAFEQRNPTTATARMLRGTVVPRGIVTVNCDDVLLFASSESEHVYLCKVDGQLLPVVTSSKLAVGPGAVTGPLQLRGSSQYQRSNWEQLLSSDPLDNQTFSFYLATHYSAFYRQFLIGLLLIAGSLASFVWWRIRRHRRAA